MIDSFCKINLGLLQIDDKYFKSHEFIINMQYNFNDIFKFNKNTSF